MAVDRHKVLARLRRHPHARIETGKKHIKVYGPNGMVTMSRGSKPGQWRAVKNLLRDLRKAGIEIDDL